METILIIVITLCATLIILGLIARFWPEEKPKKEIVSCSECHCLLYKTNASVVEGSWGAKFYYCDTHKKPYSREAVVWSWDTNRNFHKDCAGHYINKYYAELEVDKKGKPITNKTK